jgi:hypothetical protein
MDFTKKFLGWVLDKSPPSMYGIAKPLSHGGLTMPEIRLTLATPTCKARERGLRQAEDRGDVCTTKRMMARLAVAAGEGYAQIAGLLQG